MKKSKKNGKIKKGRKSFIHINQGVRDRIEALLDQGEKQCEIAKILKVDKGTISRELKRKLKNGKYEADTAEHKAVVKRSNSKYQGMKIEACPDLKKRIILELEQYRSPSEIAGILKKEKVPVQIGSNAIYKWLYSAFGQRYASCLCTKRKKKKKQEGLPKREMIKDRRSIHDKPKNKNLIEMEGDTFISPKKSHSTESVFLSTVIETHLLLGTKVPNLKSNVMVEAVNRSTKDISPDLMIFDNGIENRKHLEFNMEAYFCDPYSPWQKPHIEGNIGLLRRWFIPKGTNLGNVSEEKLQTYLYILNNKCRKSLGYKSAYEVSLERGIISKIPKISSECLKKILEEKVAIQ